MTMPSGTVNDWSDGPAFENNGTEPGSHHRRKVLTTLPAPVIATSAG
jgi:hypothetical protein